VRMNLEAVPANTELQRHYLAQLHQQETDLPGSPPTSTRPSTPSPTRTRCGRRIRKD
jgi:hypothetical protein